MDAKEPGGITLSMAVMRGASEGPALNSEPPRRRREPFDYRRGRRRAPFDSAPTRPVRLPPRRRREPFDFRAGEVLVAACGVSEKYPQGKSDAMKRAIETEETLETFPAAGLRTVADYVFDEAAASKLTL